MCFAVNFFCAGLSQRLLALVSGNSLSLLACLLYGIMPHPNHSESICNKTRNDLLQFGSQVEALIRGMYD
jgi:hypothetical protein